MGDWKHAETEGLEDQVLWSSDETPQCDFHSLLRMFMIAIQRAQFFYDDSQVSELVANLTSSEWLDNTRAKISDTKTVHTINIITINTIS